MPALQIINMKRIAIITMILCSGLIASFSMTGCYYDNEEELYSCDTTNVTYATTITGLLKNYTCLTCHVGVNPSGGFTLTEYQGVKAKVNDSTLWGAINHFDGFSPMPQGANQMSQCDINKIKAWIDAGAPNN
jgi:hypothetical protein